MPSDNVLPQLMGESFWVIDGPVVSAYGLPFPTRMAVVRLANRALWIWSPVRLDAGVRRAVDGLGEPGYIVSPNKLHHLALADWAAAWPAARLYAPPGLARKRRDLRFTAELTDEAPEGWRDQIDQVRVEGNLWMTEVLFFHRASSICLVGDLIQKHDERALNRWQRWAMTAAGVVGPEGGTPLDGRLTFIQRRRARDAIARALSWSPRQLVIAHGACTEGGAVELRRSFGWLLGA